MICPTNYSKKFVNFIQTYKSHLTETSSKNADPSYQQTHAVLYLIDHPFFTEKYHVCTKNSFSPLFSINNVQLFVRPFKGSLVDSVVRQSDWFSDCQLGVSKFE